MFDLNTLTSIFVVLALLVFGWMYISGNRPPSRAPPVGYKPLAPITGSALGKKEKKAKTGEVPLKIVWGSQTGTAEEFAKTLADEASGYNFDVENISMENYDPEELQNESLVIFITSTYGEGDPPDPAKEFFEWVLSEDRPPDLLSNLKFTGFGLGDKTYEKFNAAIRNLEKRVVELGAESIFERGEGDSDGDLQEHFDVWKSKMWDHLSSLYKFDRNRVEISKAPTFIKKIHKDGSVTPSKAVVWFKDISGPKEYGPHNPAVAHIAAIRDLHTGKSDRVCKHIEIKLPEDLRYHTGDHLAIFAPNDSKLVEAYAKRLGESPDEIISLRLRDFEKGRPYLGPCSVADALARFVDLTAIPSKRLLKTLGDLYTTDQKEKERLLHLSSEAGKDDYKVQIQSTQKILLEVLQDYPSCQPPLEHVLELLPQMQPRYYSISSASQLHPHSAHVTAVAVEYDTPSGRHHSGICTTFLASRLIGDEIHCFVRTSTFKLPPKAKTGPIIMIGPGTGIAPFRGFLQSVQAQGGFPEPVALFFGCRARDVDYLYQEELQQFLESKTLTNLFTAFSREGKEKHYVQHEIKQQSQLVWDWLQHPQAHVFICGDAKNMSKDVHKALRQVVIDSGKSAADAEAFITQLQTSNRMLLDVW